MRQKEKASKREKKKKKVKERKREKKIKRQIVTGIKFNQIFVPNDSFIPKV